MVSLTTLKSLINKALLSIFCILRIGEGYKKKQKIQFLFSESLQFIWEGKTNKGNICQVEDNKIMKCILKIIKTQKNK